MRQAKSVWHYLKFGLNHGLSGLIIDNYSCDPKKLNDEELCKVRRNEANVLWLLNLLKEITRNHEMSYLVYQKFSKRVQECFLSLSSWPLDGKKKKFREKFVSNFFVHYSHKKLVYIITSNNPIQSLKAPINNQYYI